MEQTGWSLLRSRSTVPGFSPHELAAFAEQPLPPAAVHALTYMADIEGHTVVYLRELLATRSVDDPQVASFLACWFYEESAHHGALAAVLAVSRHPLQPSPRRARGWRARAEGLGIAALAALWSDFTALHMTWGAINELTTLTAYRRLAVVAGHAPLAALLARIAHDEARHFGFYYAQAARRLAASAVTRRAVRRLVDTCWAPVGFAVRGGDLADLTDYLFCGRDGRAALQRIDATLRRLPGFRDAPLVEAWLARHALLA